jgi:hypothetical protein
VVIFGDNMILNDPVSNWPQCDVLISFFSQDNETGKAFPLLKVSQSREGFKENEKKMKYSLFRVFWSRGWFAI